MHTHRPMVEVRESSLTGNVTLTPNLSLTPTLTLAHESRNVAKYDGPTQEPKIQRLDPKSKPKPNTDQL